VRVLALRTAGAFALLEIEARLWLTATVQVQSGDLLLIPQTLVWVGRRDQSELVMFEDSMHCSQQLPEFVNARRFRVLTYSR
jgi:hypothetical protein